MSGACSIAPLVGNPKGSVTSNYIHTLATARIMAVDAISSYIQELPDWIEFKQASYAGLLTRGDRRTSDP